MEAVGAAAAIAELSGLSLRAGKAAKNLMESFVHAPAEIAELNSKIERLHLLIRQIDLLCADLPAGDSNLLFPPQHRALVSLSLQRTLDSLVSLRSSGQTPNQNGVRRRMRWAAMDKRKAQRFLRSIQEAESELDFPLQVLTIRLATINQNSIAAVTVGQDRLQSALLGSVEEIKVWVSREVSRLQDPGAQTRNSATVISTRAFSDEGVSCYREGNDDPIYKLFEHDVRRTLSYREVTVGSTSRQMNFENGWSSVGAAAVLRRKRSSTRIKFMLSLGCKLFGATILKGELQISINCRFWRFQPHIASSITALNLRPTHSPIFVACRKRDLNQVRYLLHTGEASIYDIDEDLGGLLEHVVYGKSYDENRFESPEEFLAQGQSLLEHLLDQGCDAGLYLEGSRFKKPAILLAFEDGFSTAVSSMMSHGADLNDFGNQPGGLLGNTRHKSELLWQIRLLRSLGYSDWQTSQSTDNILYGACWHRQMDLVLFALEVADINPNNTGGLDRAPIGNAAAMEWLRGVAVLVAAGARVNISNQTWNGTPLIRCIQAQNRLEDTGHFLLFQGANPNLCNYDGLSAWGMMWDMLPLAYGIGSNSLSLIRFGSSLAHLLHHGADPFEIFTTRIKIDPWLQQRRIVWDEIEDVRALDASIIFSHRGVKEQEPGNATVPMRFLRSGTTNLFRSGHNPDVFHWNYSSKIHRVQDGRYTEGADSDALEYDYNSDIELSEVDEYYVNSHKFSHRNEASRGPAWSVDNLENQKSKHRLNPMRFYHHITNKQGRRQLSRYPLTRALCDALQHSGFRAEMDDEGDIWYDCDDGDRYFDAWEYQDADQDDETWLPKACPICQNFEGYGLGHILEIAERARAQYYEYKDKVKQGKMSMCL
ncbi:hypothetical protein G7054_g445 [Neopestalotiopsis clavispora]|nr:hypothetical protein G7054_g445 [Neopestalotiopsis clavispora]